MTATSLSAAGAAAALEKYEPVIGLEGLRRTRGLREFLISISSVAIREGRYASLSLWDDGADWIQFQSGPDRPVGTTAIRLSESL
jgi:hypothetical protein